MHVYIRDLLKSGSHFGKLLYNINKVVGLSRRLYIGNSVIVWRKSLTVQNFDDWNKQSVILTMKILTNIVAFQLSMQ